MARIKRQNRYRFILTSVLFIVLTIFTPSMSICETVTLEFLGENLKTFVELAGDFDQTNFDVVRGKQTTASGRFLFLKPNLMRWEYITPDPYSIIVGNRLIWIFDPILESVTIHDRSNIEGFQMLSILFDPIKLNQYFKQHHSNKSYLESNLEDKKLYLAYKKSDPNISEIQIAFDSSYIIKEFVMVEHNQNYRKIRFAAVNTTSGLNKSDFEFKIPEGVEIIDKTKENP